jgi:peptidoglycan biosynthesis protein MviN/MurJ (putative lipid II flippase)
VRAYYAAGHTRQPVLINVSSALGTILAAALLLAAFIRWEWLRTWFDLALRVQNVPATAVLALPLAFSLGAIFNALWMWRAFQRDFGRFPRVVDRAIVQSATASLAAGLAAYVGLNILDNFFNLNNFWGVFGQGAVAGLAGVAVFGLILRAWGNEELAELSRSLHSKFWRARPVAAEPEAL